MRSAVLALLGLVGALGAVAENDDDVNCNPICTPTRVEPLIPDSTCDCDSWGDPHFLLMGPRLFGDKVTPLFVDGGTYILSQHTAHEFGVQIQTETCRTDKLCISAVGVRLGNSYSANFKYTLEDGLVDSYNKRVSFYSNNDVCNKWRGNSTNMLVVNQGVAPCATASDCPISDPAYSTLGRCKKACLETTGCVAIQFSTTVGDLGCAFKSVRLADTELITAGSGENYWERVPCGYFNAGDGKYVKVTYDEKFPNGRFYFVDITKGSAVELRTGALADDGIRLHVSVPTDWNDALTGICGTCVDGQEFQDASGTTQDITSTIEALTTNFFDSWEIDPESTESLFKTV